MKKGIIVAAILVLAVLVAALPLSERYAAGQIKAEIQRDGHGSVDAVEVGLFDRRVVLTNLQLHVDGELTARRWEASGLSFSLADLLEGRMPLADVRLGDPLRADHIKLTDAKLVDRASGSSWAVGSLVIEGLDLARYDATVAGPYRLPILLARIGAALSVHRIEEKKLVYTVPLTGDTIGIQEFRMDGVDHGKIGAVALEGLEATAKGQDAASFKVAEVKAKEVDLQRMLPRLASASWGPGRPLGRLDLGFARASGFGGLLLAQYGVSLDAISLEKTRDAVGSSKSRLRVDDLTLRPGTDPEAAKLSILLQAMGLRKLGLGFDCAGEERRGKAALAISDCRLTVADLGDLSLVAGFVDADEAFWRAIDEGNPLELARSSIALGSAKLSIADKGMIDRSVRALAAATRQLPTAARAKLAQDIRSYQPPDVLITEDLTKLLDTIARFIEQGGILEIEAKPDPPIGLAAAARLSSPGPDLVNLFGLSAKLSR